MFKKITAKKATDKEILEMQKRVANLTTNEISKFINELIKIADAENADRVITVNMALRALDHCKPTSKMLRVWNVEAYEKAKQKFNDTETSDKTDNETDKEADNGETYISVKKIIDGVCEIDCDGFVEDQLQLIAAFILQTANSTETSPNQLLLEIMRKVCNMEVSENE